MKMKLVIGFAALLLAPVSAISSNQSAPPMEPTVTMGSVAMDIPVEMVKRMSVLTNYLALNSGLNIRFRPSPNLSSAVDEIGAGQTQIAYLTPVAYIDAQRKYGVVPLVAPTINGKPTFSLVIGAKSGSSIRSPADLKGRRFAFGDEKALLQKAAVASMGLGTTDFSQFAYLKHYDNIAKAVLAGDFDGGILKDSTADDFKDKGIVVIGSTPPLPSYVFAVHSSMPVSIRNKLRDAFLSLKKDNPVGAVTLEAFDSTYDGFVVVQDSAYDNVRKLIQPFQK